MESDKKYMYEMEKAYDLRNYEISNFWKRGWFFGAFVIFLLSANFKIHEIVSDPSFLNYPSQQPIGNPYSVIISFIALITSSVQAIMNRASKYWQERWEYKLKNREMLSRKEITLTEQYEYHRISACILDKEESLLTRAQRISVSKLAFIVWDVIVILCLFIWVSEVVNYVVKKPTNPAIWVIAFHLIVGLYITYFVVKGNLTSGFDIGMDKFSPSPNASRGQKECEKANYLLQKRAIIKNLKREYVGEDRVK